MRTGLTMTALLLAGALTYAQAPQTPQSPQAPKTTTPQPQSRPQAQSAAQTITITGCLKEEKAVPGEKPNVAERAGVGEDYVLTNVKMASSSPVSGIALGTKYEIDGISNDDLKKHVNQQVEVTGTIAQANATAGADATPDFKGTSIKMLSATCSAN